MHCYGYLPQGFARYGPLCFASQQVQCTNNFRIAATDLVKGIRNAPDEQAYIAAAVQDIKKELKSTDMKTKAIAVQKLTHVCGLCLRAHA